MTEVQRDGQGGGESAARTLGYWCQNPGVGMRSLAAGGVRSVVLTSGTLSPLASFALELGLPFRHQLENPHVISPSQIMVGVLPRGPSGAPPRAPPPTTPLRPPLCSPPTQQPDDGTTSAGVELTSTYQHRESEAYKCELGHTLANLARLVPQVRATAAPVVKRL